MFKPVAGVGGDGDVVLYTIHFYESKENFIRRYDIQLSPEVQEQNMEQ